MSHSTIGGGVLDIVIPCLNERTWLPDLAARLAIGPHAEDVYLIVSDSGSTDGTVEYVRSTLEGENVYLKASRLGVAAARNDGARALSAPWILFLDADCLVSNDFVSALVRQVDRLEYDVYGFNFVSDSAKLSMRMGTRATYLFFRLLSLTSVGAVPGFAMLVRRAAFDSVGGFDEGLSIAEDLDFHERIIRSGGQSGWLRLSVAVSPCRFEASDKRLKLARHLVVTEFWRITRRKRYFRSPNYEFGNHSKVVYERRSPR